jgi:hemerythrin-like domain-containing protein
MKRHVSLHPLSQHHHFALIQALEIRRARHEPAAKRALALRRVAEKFVRFWKKAGQQHFREEEEVLLPAYARHVLLDADADVMRMLAEHAAIRALVADIEALLATKQPVEEKITELGRLLNDHVRLEENVIFPRVQKVLGEAELAAMGRGLTRLHRKGESCEF